MVGIYDGWLVFLSVVVAIVASYVALDLRTRMRSSLLWLIVGAISLGSGIWSMHFIGMLAFRLPIPVAFDKGITALSLLVPILISTLAFYAINGEPPRRARLVLSGVGIGLAIVAMHYIGMAAMRMEPPIRYAPWLVGLSVLIALGASLGGVWSAFRLPMETLGAAFWKKTGSALVTGSGISGMHYTGMAAASFAPDSVCMVGGWNVDSFWLATTLGAFTLLFQLATLLIASYDAFRVYRLASHADRVQEAERRHLSRELHDRVGPNLTALGINLGLLKTGLAREPHPELHSRLEDSIGLVDSTADAIENVMAELRPPMLDEHGLLQALRWYAKEFSARTGIEVVVRGEEPKRRPAPEIEITLFRIAQEALNNVAKHARAKRVELELYTSEGKHVLAVSDDGIGFDRAARDPATPSGSGIATMRERAHAVGGHIEVRSQPGAGTRVVVQVPRSHDD